MPEQLEAVDICFLELVVHGVGDEVGHSSSVQQKNEELVEGHDWWFVVASLLSELLAPP